MPERLVLCLRDVRLVHEQEPEASDQGWGGGTTVETLPSPCRKATWIDGVSIHFVSVHRYFSFGPFVSGR